MELRCPVCEYPQADGRHLANHLAFTALVRGGSHEEWLDEHVPEWESMGEDGLTAALTDEIDAVEDEPVFESTGSHSHHHHDHTQHQHGTTPSDQRPQADIDIPVTDLPDSLSGESEDDLSEETAEVLERARELTRQRRTSDDEPEDR